MELLNREYQRRLLIELAAHYPSSVAADFLEQQAPGSVRVNVSYLHEHGLVRGKWYGSLDQGNMLVEATVTAKGMDFLADDGGLGAILGVVTIRVHEDTIKDLVAAKIEATDLSPEKKQAFMYKLRELPADATKHLALKLVDAGLANWQKAFPLLQGVLG